jgi:hypothetical protein
LHVIVILRIEGHQSKGRVLHKQARYVVFKVFGYIKRDVDNGHPVYDVAKCQERAADACRVGLRTPQCTVKEVKSSVKPLKSDGQSAG